MSARLTNFVSERELTFTFAVVARPSSVCRLSVTFVHLTQAIEIFGNVFTPFGALATVNIQVYFFGGRPRRTAPTGELNTRGAAEYSDFGPIKSYISETVHLVINVKKCCCIRIDQRSNVICQRLCSVNGAFLPWFTEIKYLHRVSKKHPLILLAIS